MPGNPESLQKRSESQDLGELLALAGRLLVLVLDRQALGEPVAQPQAGLAVIELLAEVLAELEAHSGSFLRATGTPARVLAGPAWVSFRTSFLSPRD
jgi:hypothetical protein